MVHIRHLPDAAPDAEPLSFGHSGWLWHDAFLLYDTKTDSLWHHLTGRALSGPLRGHALPSVPTLLTRWRTWLRAHPDTLVLAKPTESEAPVHTDVYASRTQTLRLGTAVHVGAEDRLYPWSELRVPQVVHDEVAGRSLVLVYEHPTRTGVAWISDDPVLRLEPVHDKRGNLTLRELDGGREWNPWTGHSVPPGSTSPFERVRQSTWEVEAWRRQHPHGSVWSRR